LSYGGQVAHPAMLRYVCPARLFRMAASGLSFGASMRFNVLVS
jgi:hypothetical protein